MDFSLDKNLKGIVNAVTYLEWPGYGEDISKKTEKFWKRLQLSMPKKKMTECSESCISDSSSAGLSSSKSDFVKNSPILKKLSLDFIPNNSTTKAMAQPVDEVHENHGYLDDDEEIYDEIINIDETLNELSASNTPHLETKSTSNGFENNSVTESEEETFSEIKSETNTISLDVEHANPKYFEIEV